MVSVHIVDPWEGVANLQNQRSGHASSQPADTNQLNFGSGSEPSYISSEKYGTWNCTSLIKEKSFVDNSLPQASASQDAAADNDALMVFLIGVPTSGGGIKSEVARLKGEQEALRRAIRDKNCDSTQRDTRTTSTNNGNNGDVKEKLRALQALKSSGHITEEEYDNMLKNIIH